MQITESHVPVRQPKPGERQRIPSPLSFYPHQNLYYKDTPSLIEQTEVSDFGGNIGIRVSATVRQE